MKRFFSTAFVLLIAAHVFAQFPAPYCGPLTFGANVEPITSVVFAGINNTSSATVGGVAHENFTAQSATVTAGQLYPIELKGNTDGQFIDALSVFVDWNQDADFDDQGESYYIGTISNSTGTDAVVLNGNIAVPGTAMGGSTRLRVVKTWNEGNTADLPTPCNTNIPGFGQVEDYSVNVTAITQCLTGTNFPAATVSISTCDGSPNLISTQSQAGQYFDVSVTSGQTYTFHSSVGTDFFTISTDGGATAAFSGTSPFVWIATTTGTARVYLHTDINCGTQSVDRTTMVSCGSSCLNGTLFPASTYLPSVCDSVTLNEVTANASTGQYAEVLVQAGSFYTFSSSIATDYITLSLDGITAVAEGVGPLFWQATASTSVRFYIHSDEFCGVDTLTRSKYVTCKIQEVPGCVSNLMPINGDTLYYSVGSYPFTWDPPVTGDPVDTYTIYFGLDSTSSFYNVSFPAGNLLNITLDQSDIGQTYYWWIIPSNAAGASNCPPIIHVIYILASPPTGINDGFEASLSVYPNPVKDMFALKNADDIESVQVINVLGQIVHSQTIDGGERQVNVSTLPAGSYLLRATSVEGRIQTVRFLKQ